MIESFSADEWMVVLIHVQGFMADPSDVDDMVTKTALNK